MILCIDVLVSVYGWIYIDLLCVVLLLELILLLIGYVVWLELIYCLWLYVVVFMLLICYFLLISLWLAAVCSGYYGGWNVFVNS